MLPKADAVRNIAVYRLECHSSNGVGSINRANLGTAQMQYLLEPNRHKGKKYQPAEEKGKQKAAQAQVYRIFHFYNPSITLYTYYMQNLCQT